MSNILLWNIDGPTAKAASVCYPFPERDKPAKQFEGRFLTTKTWNDRVIQPATWKSGKLLSRPEEIIKQFQDGRYTQAHALVMVWGTMWRTSPYIYGERKPERI